MPFNNIFWTSLLCATSTVLVHRFAPSPWPFLSGFFFLLFPFLHYLCCSVYIFALHQYMGTHTKQVFSVVIFAYFAGSNNSVLSSYLLLHFRYASCCAKWAYVVRLFFLFIILFFSTLLLSFSCWYFHVFFHAFEVAQNDLYLFLEFTNTTKRGRNGNFVQISQKTIPFKWFVRVTRGRSFDSKVSKSNCKKILSFKITSRITTQNINQHATPRTRDR